MDITFTEIDNLDDSLEEINQNPYFNENALPNKTSKIQKNKSILKNNKSFQPETQKGNNINDENVPINRSSSIENNSINKMNHPTQFQRRNKKKGISYDDILSSMNTVVIDGKLEFIRNDNELQRIQRENSEKNEQQVKKIVKFNQTHHTPLDPNVKNSYIFNKYFKDYKDPSIIENPTVPLTKQQLLKKILIDKITQYNDQIRISQIKSTKLLFNSNNNIIRTAPTTYNQNGLNHLFKFK